MQISWHLCLKAWVQFFLFDWSSFHKSKSNDFLYICVANIYIDDFVSGQETRSIFLLAFRGIKQRGCMGLNKSPHFYQFLFVIWNIYSTF